MALSQRENDIAEAVRRGLMTIAQAQQALRAGPQVPLGAGQTLEPPTERGTVATELRAAKRTFEKATGERIGLDDFAAARRVFGFLTPLIDTAAAVGDVTIGGLAGGASLLGSGLGALTGDPARARRDITALVTESPILGTAPLPQQTLAAAGRASQLGRRAPTPQDAATVERSAEIPPAPTLRRAGEEAITPDQVLTAEQQRLQPPPQFAQEALGGRLAPVKKKTELALTSINDAIDRLFPVGGRVNARLDEALRLDNITPQTIANRAVQFEQRTGQRPTILQLGGENVEGLARSSAGPVGEGRTVIQEFRATILDSQTKNVQDIAERTLTTPGKNFFKDVRTLEKQMQKDAAPLYKAAFKQAVPVTEGISDIIKTPVGKRALARANTILKQERQNPNNLGMQNLRDGEGEVSIELLDAVKRGFNDVIEGKYRDKTTKRLVLDDLGRATQNTLTDFVSEIDAASPVYKEARGAFAGPAKLRDALNDGRNVVKSTKVTPEQIAVRLESMTPSERELYRSGVMRGLIDVMQGAVTDTNRVRKLVRSEGLQNKLRAVFDDRNAADEFIRQLQEAEALAGRVQRVSPTTGSLTAVRGADVTGFSGINVRREAVADLIQRGFDKFRQQRSTRNEQVINRDIASILTQPLTDDVLLELQRRLQQ